MVRVCLREVTRENFQECIQMNAAPGQEPFVAPNVYSLAQAKVNHRLTPCAVYDDRIRGYPPGPEDPMVAFAMYQIRDGVGFIMRLLVAAAHQRKGYGRATMVEVIRQLKLHPEVEWISTSVHKKNPAALALYRGLGFAEFGKEDPVEIYLKLPWDPKG